MHGRLAAFDIVFDLSAIGMIARFVRHLTIELFQRARMIGCAPACALKLALLSTDFC
jgi:hypothetical protein